ncbi:MAG TPA: hypothetical protein VGL72_20900 [Bryobacteraceae bacterium]
MSVTVGQAIYAACQWGMISVLATLGNPEIVGHYALGVAVSAPILMVAPGRRRLAAAADLRVMSLVFALLGVAAVGFLEHSIQDRLIIVMVAMAQSVEWITDIYSGRRRALSRGLHGGLSVLTLAFLVTATGRAGAGLLGVLIVRLLVLFFYDFRQHRAPHENSLPQSVHDAFGSFAASVPCYFIAHILGFHLLGIFAAIASLAPTGNVLASALAQAAAPALRNSYEEGDHQGFTRLSLRLVCFGLVLGLSAVAGSLTIGGWVLTNLFGPQYATYQVLLVALAAASGIGFMASLLGCILNAGRRLDEQVSIAIIAIALTALACVALVPRVGILGAAYALGLGGMAQVIGQLWLVRSVARKPRKRVLLDLLRQPVA